MLLLWCWGWCLQSKKTLLQLLLDWGLSPNLPVCLTPNMLRDSAPSTPQGSRHLWWTPLLFAVSVCDGNLSLVSLLLEFGARISCSLDDLQAGHSEVLSMAHKKGFEDLTGLLVEH